MSEYEGSSPHDGTDAPPPARTPGGESASRRNAALAQLFDVSPFPAVVSRLRDHTVIAINQHTAETFGISKADAAGLSVLDYHSDPSARQRVTELLRREGRADGLRLQVRRLNGEPFWVLASVMALLMMMEWADLAKVNATTKRLSMFALSVPLAILSPLAAGPGFFAVGLVLGAAFFVTIAARSQQLGLGVLYAGFPVAALLFLREQENGLVLVFWTLAIVWATDIGAYFAGRLIDQNIDPRQAGIDWKAFRESQRDPAREAVGSALVLDEVARREQLSVDDAEVEQEIARYAERTGRTAAAVRAVLEKEGGLSRIHAGLRREKAVDLALSHARITDEQPAEPVDEQ